MFEWLAKIGFTVIFDKLVAWLKGLYDHYRKKKVSEETNQEIKKDIEDAKTDDELQDALNHAGRHLGGDNHS